MAGIRIISNANSNLVASYSWPRYKYLIVSFEMEETAD